MFVPVKLHALNKLRSTIGSRCHTSTVTKRITLPTAAPKSDRMGTDDQHNRQAHRRQSSCANSLKGAETDQPAHRGRTTDTCACLRECAAEGTQAKQDHGDQQQTLAPILVGKASNGDQEYCIHQVIGIEDPTGREQVCLQVGLYAWYGDIHDVHVEHGHEKTKEYCCQHEPGFNRFRTYHQYWRRCMRSPAPKRC